MICFAGMGEQIHLARKEGGTAVFFRRGLVDLSAVQGSAGLMKQDPLFRNSRCETSSV